MDSLLDHDQDLLAPPWGSLGRDAVLGAVAAVTKLLLNVLNTTRVINHATYTDLVMHRPPGVGLLTISNHTSTFDDPGLPCALLPLSFFWSEHTHRKNRWTMCAKDICFTNHMFTQFFLNGKVLPVERGAGVDQGSVSVAARALGGGDWLHIFPEGRVTPDGRVGPFRQGIGKLICEAQAVHGRDPIILPFFHSGMSRVMPFKSSLPRVGQQVVVAVGQPLDLSHITCRCNQPGEDQPQVWRDLAVALRQAVTELQDSVPPNPNQILERPDVAEYERKYQERQRRLREEEQQQQQQVGGQQQQQQQAPVLMLQQQQQGGRRQGSSSSEGKQQQDVGGVEQQWRQQQRQLMAVIRRVSRQAQVDIAHTVDLELHEQQQQQQQHPEQQQPWRQQLHRRWQQGQQLMQTWQQHQDWQVAYLLALRAKAKAAATTAAAAAGVVSNKGSSVVSAAGAAADTRGGGKAGGGGGGGSSNSSNSSWAWAVAWLPFASSMTGGPAEGVHRE